MRAGGRHGLALRGQLRAWRSRLGRLPGLGWPRVLVWNSGPHVSGLGMELSPLPKGLEKRSVSETCVRGAVRLVWNSAGTGLARLGRQDLSNGAAR